MFYTVHDVASMLKVHPETIKREVNRKKLNCFKVGTELRFTQQQIDEYSNTISNAKSLREVELEKTISELKAELDKKEKLINLIKDEVLRVS